MPNIFGLGPELANVIGIAGMLCIVGAYACNTVMDKADPLAVNSVNLVGALLLALSLTVHFNLASMILEAVWAVIAIYGIVKAVRTGRKARQS